MNNKNYRLLCRGDVLKNITELSKLRCRFDDNNVAYRLLAPFKIEELNQEPPVLVFRDILSNAEIETIIQLATPEVNVI